MMIFSPKYRSQGGAFLDLVAFLLTYPWATFVSLAASCYITSTAEKSRYKLKLAQWFILGPALASLAITTLPFAVMGFAMWVAICVFCHSEPLTHLRLDDIKVKKDSGGVGGIGGSGDACEEPVVNKHNYTFLTANVLLGHEVTGKGQNAAFVYNRLKGIAQTLQHQPNKNLENIDILNKNNDKADSVLTDFPHLDFICFQEVFDRFFSLALISALRKVYSHFVYDVGKHSFSTNLFCLGSGLMFASRFPILETRFYPFSTKGKSKKWGFQHMISYGVLHCKLDLGNKIDGSPKVGYVANLHNVAYQGKEKLLLAAMDEIVSSVDNFKRDTLLGDESVQFDVICGDFNCDNVSPSDQEVSNHEIFKLYEDPASIKPGVDTAWCVGTELRQKTLNNPEMMDKHKFREVLMDDARRRHYVIDADVASQTFDLMTVEPKVNEEGEVVAEEWGGKRRIDRVLVRRGLGSRVTGVGYVTALAGLTDHVPVATSLVNHG